MNGNRPKATILQAGTVSREGNDYRIVGWSFDCKGVVPMLNILDDETILYAGYTIEELQNISNGETADGHTN